MHMVIRRYQVARRERHEIVQKVREGFIAILRQASGLRGYYVLDALDGVSAVGRLRYRPATPPAGT